MPCFSITLFSLMLRQRRAMRARRVDADTLFAMLMPLTPLFRFRRAIAATPMMATSHHCECYRRVYQCHVPAAMPLLFSRHTPYAVDDAIIAIIFFAAIIRRSLLRQRHYFDKHAAFIDFRYYAITPLRHAADIATCHTLSYCCR